MPRRVTEPSTAPAAFEGLLPRDPRVEVRKLFGNPCGYVNGTMFTSVHEQRWIVRLAADERARLLDVEGAEIFEPLKGKPMPEYVRIPAVIADDRRKLRAWVKRAFEYCVTLPPPRPRRAT
jgi:TfoX/Sxy family transcriptional regulator of competence genes